MTGLLSAVGSVSASRTVCSERFDCICYMQMIHSQSIESELQTIQTNVQLNVTTLIFISLCLDVCRQGAGLGFRKSTPFYMGLPVL